MKKMILLLLATFISFSFIGCKKEIPNYTVEDAFSLMNEAIQNYLDCKSISLEYSGRYESTNYNINEFMRVKMKNMDDSDLVGQVELYVTENEKDYDSVINYIDGWVYTERITTDSTDYVKKESEYGTYVSLYKAYLKSTIDFDRTRSQSISYNDDTLTVYFELESSAVTSTFYVSSVLKTVNYATVTITLTHEAKLVSMAVQYGGKVDDIAGTESYEIAILKLDQYVIINQLSSSEKSQYVEETDS